MPPAFNTEAASQETLLGPKGDPKQLSTLSTQRQEMVITRLATPSGKRKQPSKWPSPVQAGEKQAGSDH